ncbi:MAG TPA: hypothetical protein VLJ11_21545 [Bryobacteraceae bacterium]|nr:hypothetical protein [Bryobacteraceae bacterium]
MPFTQKTLNAFEMTGRLAACEIAAVNPEHRAFIGVYPPINRGIIGSSTDLSCQYSW